MEMDQRGLEGELRWIEVDVKDEGGIVVPENGKLNQSIWRSH
jgi:hypothetical protein